MVRVQQLTGETVELAYVDQRATREKNQWIKRPSMEFTRKSSVTQKPNAGSCFYHGAG